MHTPSTCRPPAVAPAVLRRASSGTSSSSTGCRRPSSPCCRRTVPALSRTRPSHVRGVALQSFLAGVPTVLVGFRDERGTVRRDCARWREIARDGGRLREIRCTSSRASRPRRCTGSCAARGTRCGVCIPGPYRLSPSSRWTKADTPVVAMGEAAGPLPPPCCLCAGPKLRHICIPTTPREETHSAASRRIPLPSLYS